ncbi:MAG: HD domain-containing phosphohydrolase [Burkholderiales bacterium]
MKSDTVIETIEVAALTIGMHIHLDGGWLSHPFPRSSFKISSREQIAILRSLGLQRVRWSPQDSDFSHGASRWETSSLTSVAGSDCVAPPVASDTADPAPDSAAEAASVVATPTPQDLHRAALAAQRAALAACEREFAAAARVARQVFEGIAAQPVAARHTAQALTRQLLDQMIGSQELCIRLLTEGAGDKVSAHALNVSVISLLMGRNFNLSEAEMLDLGLGALLHDIGKAEVPERLRHREDHFGAAEHKIYETHVALGIAQARRMELAPGASLVIAQHHELIDGSGFPLKLQSDRTTVPSRIVSLVNRYDNLCNPANPGKAITPHEAVALMFAQGKNKYDPAILGAFIKMMGVYPAGSVVQLTDDRYAMVVGVNSSRPLKPRVLVHEAGVPRDEALVLDLETVSGLGIRRSLKPLALPARTLDYLSPRPRVSYFFEPTQDGGALA